jgi:hypothetical protein
MGAQVTQKDRERVETFNAKLLRMPPEKAAAIILNGVAAARPRIPVGTDARIVDTLARRFPSAAPKLCVWFDKRTFAGATHTSSTAGQITS